MSLYHFEKSVIRSQPWLLCLPYQQVESIEWPVILATFGATFWLVNLYQSLSSAVPSQVPPFWNAKVPRCIRDMDPGHSHQNSSDAKIEGLSISHYPCFGTLSLFVSSVCVCVCQLCFAMMCLLQMTYDRFLSNRIRNCCCTLIPEWLRGRIHRKWNHHEPWWTMNHESLKRTSRFTRCGPSRTTKTQKISKDTATGIRSSSTKKVME